MIRRLTLSTLLALALSLGLSSFGLAQQEFRWKFEEGEQLSIAIRQETTSTSGSPEAEGLEASTTLDYEIVFGWEVLSVDDDGNATITQTFDRVKMSMDLPGQGQVQFDTEDEEEAESGAARFAEGILPLIGTTVEVTMNPQGDVVDFNIPAETQAAFRGSTFGSLFSEVGMKQLLGQGLIVLPREAIKEGQEWDRQVDLAFGMKLNAHYTYTGEQEHEGEEVSVFDVAPTMELALDETGGEEDMEISISNEDGSGQVWFDQEAGRVVESSIDQSYKINISFGDQETSTLFELHTTLELSPAED